MNIHGKHINFFQKCTILYWVTQLEVETLDCKTLTRFPNLDEIGHP